jgi:hypothetical protein
MPHLYRILSASLNITSERVLVTFTYVGPKNSKSIDSKLICLGIWLSECKNSMFYCFYNTENKEVCLTKVIPYVLIFLLLLSTIS